MPAPIQARVLNAAIVGTGRIAGELEADPKREHPCTHAGMYQVSSEIRLKACVGRNQTAAKTFAAQWNIPASYDSLDQMLQSEKIDILSVCTPATTHAAIVRKAARARIPVIFCEKALATSLQEANSMIRTCSRNNSLLCVNHGRRYGWDYQAARQLIQDGQIGKVQSATAVFSGSLMHTGTHMFDILRYLFGDVRGVRGRLFKPGKTRCIPSGYHVNEASSKKYPDPDVIGELTFPRNLRVMISGRLKSYFIFEVDIWGTGGRIRIGNHLHQLYQAAPSPHYSGFTGLAPQAFPAPPARTNPWLHILEDLIRAARQGQPTRSTGQSARKAMEIGLALKHSHDRGETWVRLPLRNKELQVLSK